MKNVGQNIKKLRLKRQWNQQYVAGKLNISIPAFSKIETNNTDISLTRLAELAAVFQVDVFEILFEPGENGKRALESELHECKIMLEAKNREISELQKTMIDLFIELRSK